MNALKICVLFSSAIMAFALTACGGGDPDPELVTCTVQQCTDPK